MDTTDIEPENEPKQPPFQPEELQKEFQELIQKKFGGQVQVVSMTGDMPLEGLSEPA
ncbi:MAG: hypothetical protein HRT44_04915, partial [Bdellovibrionales bacterium]|nr:hypothetical protein [Bdellovibrionales bacterium]